MAHLCVPGKKPLRDALDVRNGFIISQHRDYIEREVRQVYPHTVVFRELIAESTCVLYALGLFRDRTYRAIALNFGRKIFAGRAFIERIGSGERVKLIFSRKGFDSSAGGVPSPLVDGPLEPGLSRQSRSASE